MRVACLWFHAGLPAPLSITQVAEHCLRLSPQICFRQEEALFIEFGKCRRLYSEVSFGARAEVIMRQLGAEATLGIADNIPEALLLAKYWQPPETQPQPLTSIRNLNNPVKVDIPTLPLKVLLELADPFHRDEVMQKYVLHMIHSFQDLGVRQLQQFRQIPLAELTSRFGAIGILCAQRVRGEIQLPWPFWKPEEIVFEKAEFPYFEFYGELEPILFALKTQLDRIFQRLFVRGVKAQKMQVKIFCEVTSMSPEPFRLFEFDFMFPQSTTKGTLAIIQERLTREFQKNPITTPIEGLETRVTETVAGHAGQKNLLNNHEEIAEQLNSLLNRLGEVHGRKNIFQAELTEDRRPEKSWRPREKSARDSEALRKAAKQKNPAPKNPVQIAGVIPTRPTYLLKPEKVQLSGDFIYIRGKRHKILEWSAEVERINGGWHEESGISSHRQPPEASDHGSDDASDKRDSFRDTFFRDYYNLVLDNGVMVSVFRTDEREFYMHGYFG